MYGITGIEFQWFKSYYIKSYIIYTMLLIKSSEILKFAMYADDTCVYNSNISATDNARIMNGELLRLVSRWLDRNCFKFEYKKMSLTSTLWGKNVEFEKETSIYWLMMLG